MPSFVASNKFDLARILQRLTGIPLPATITWQKGAKRGLSANGLFHAWMGEIAKATHDTPTSVKADCHIRWGINFQCAADPQYADFIKAAIGGRPRSQVKDMIERGYVPCTSLMTKRTLSQYMDAVWREYAPHVDLMDPESLKWRNAG